MNQTKMTLGALALDLNRVAIGIHRGSEKAAERFFQEALKRKEEVRREKMPKYIKKILAEIKPEQKLDEPAAERLMVYSILFENYAVKS